MSPLLLVQLSFIKPIFRIIFTQNLAFLQLVLPDWTGYQIWVFKSLAGWFWPNQHFFCYNSRPDTYRIWSLLFFMVGCSFLIWCGSNSPDDTVEKSLRTTLILSLPVCFSCWQRWYKLLLNYFGWRRNLSKELRFLFYIPAFFYVMSFVFICTRLFMYTMIRVENTDGYMQLKHW